MTFPTELHLAETPAISIANLPVSGTPTFYYDELFDADASPSIVVAAQKVLSSPSWPKNSIWLPSIPQSWTIVPGHHYIFEIVASTSSFLSCSGNYA